MLRGSFAKGGVFCIKSQDAVTDLCKVDYNMEDLSNDYGSLDPQYNVYDLKCITGKDYYRAWIDYDDPSEWDVVNNNHTTKGGFEIAPWTSHLYHTYIVPWVKRYNMPHEDKYVAPVPIGTADKSTIDLFRQAGKVLWSGEFEVSSKEFFEGFLMKEMDLVK